MQYDASIYISTGMSATSIKWTNTKINWSELVKRLKTPHHTNETIKEFLKASKTDQSKIKDVGGFVGGFLRGGRRKPENVTFRQLLTLDLDFAHRYFWSDFEIQFQCAAVLHGTHKHTEESPRYRLIIPLSREVSPDEYVAIARKVAGELGIELFDNTTFEVNRLMFWPSSPKDVKYYVEVQDAPFLDADEILNSYVDWTDSSQWPTSETKLKEITGLAKKQEDPELKKGIIGAFCRTYSISEAIETFLQDEYTPCLNSDRYTYTKGSAAAGLVTYEDKFAFSHHGTDPTGGKLCNAFDLVRVHKFGHLDGETGHAQSQKAMEDLVLSDAQVKRTVAVETVSNAKYEFADITIEKEKEDLSWMEDLEMDGKKRYLSSSTNINLIFKHDVNLVDAFKNNIFDNKFYICKTVPWRPVNKPEPIKDVDYAGVRNYIETIYGIVGSSKIDDALKIIFESNSFHPVRNYLKSLKWDGVKRVDYLLCDYFGTDENEYTHETIRKCLVGAVARVFEPGVKFDSVLTLVGDQGTGKSTFVSKLGLDWFSDTFTTVSGKESFEQIQGKWLVEIAELAGLRKADLENVKNYLSKQADHFRPAYARVTEEFKRQNIFIATTNTKDFLKDTSGNRRFWPIDINQDMAMSSVWSLTRQDIDQIWAEAYKLYKAGEDLILSLKAQAIAKHEQNRHSESDERVGIIEQYLERKLPEDWDEKDIFERRIWLSDPCAGGHVERKFVCVAEVWTECLNKEKEDMNRYNTREINEILRSLQGWEASKSTKNFKHYGKQKYYSVKKSY